MAKKPNWIYSEGTPNDRYYKYLTNLCEKEGLDYYKVSQDYNRFEKFDNKGRLWLGFANRDLHFVKSFNFQDN